MEAHDSYLFNGKTMVKGTEFRVRGEYGATFRFHRHLVYPDGRQVIDCFGGPKNVTMWRSFRPDRITRITKLTPSPRVK